MTGSVHGIVTNPIFQALPANDQAFGGSLFMGCLMRCRLLFTIPDVR